MKLEKTKLNFITFCGFISLLAVLTFVGFITFYLVGITKWFNNFDFIKFFNENKLAILIILIVFVVFDFLSTICISTIKWESNWSKSEKFIFCFLNIILPFLIPFIFAIIYKTKLKVQTQTKIENKEIMERNLPSLKISRYKPHNYIVISSNKKYECNLKYYEMK